MHTLVVTTFALISKNCPFQEKQKQSLQIYMFLYVCMFKYIKNSFNQFNTLISADCIYTERNRQTDRDRVKERDRERERERERDAYIYILREREVYCLLAKDPHTYSTKHTNICTSL